MILTKGIDLQIVLGGGVATTQPHIHVDFIEWTNAGMAAPPNTQISAANSGTDVTILNAPTTAKAREIIAIEIHNADSASVTLTIKTDDGTTERTIYKVTLATLENAYWYRGAGWSAFTTAGARK